MKCTKQVLCRSQWTCGFSQVAFPKSKLLVIFMSLTFILFRMILVNVYLLHLLSTGVPLNSLRLN